MKTTAVILASVCLGLTAPAVAHAQLTGKAAARFGMVDPQQGQGQGQPRGGRDNEERPVSRPQPERPQIRLVPINQVIAQIERMTPGRLLDAVPADPGSSRPVYRIRWQADSGQRIDFTVDAQSGAIIGRSGG